MSPPSAATPWYRQLWPWLLIAIPACTVVAAMVTIALAVRSADGVVVDDYYKHGKAINQTLARDRRASELGLAAELLRGDNGALRLLPNQALERSLQLRFSHATQPDRDQVLQLHSSDGRVFDGQLQALGPGRWHLQLEPLGGGDWRLRGQTTDPGFRRLRLAARP